MGLSRLPQDQQSALVFIEAILHPKPEDRSSYQSLIDMIDNGQWAKIQGAAKMIQGSAAPSEAAFAAVGDQPPGLRSAEFFLVLVDMKNDADTTSQLVQAFQTGCWDDIAKKVVAAGSANFSFSGADLRQAAGGSYPASCQQPGLVEQLLATALGSASDLTRLLQTSIADIFSGDFDTLFTKDLGDYFSKDFVASLQSLVSVLAGGVDEILKTLHIPDIPIDLPGGLGGVVTNTASDAGGKVEEGAKKAAKKLDPRHWP